MKWEFLQPKRGDIVRVSFGNFYHYGIYVDDTEVIQFGLSPSLNVGLKEADIKVLSSDVETFLNGGFLEVGVLDKKEQKSRLSVEETVTRARARIGEGGYHLLYNNCEHFVNSCVFNKASCSATDDVRKKILAIPVLSVYTACIPTDAKLGNLFPKERDLEVRSCANEEVRKEKYYVWKLLEHALYHTFGKKMEKLVFSKTSNGKWGCDGFEFSLSHSNGAVAVAVSRREVGVDIERKREIMNGISSKMLSKREMEEYNRVLDNEKNDWLLQKWTQKESVFKRTAVKGLAIKDLEIKDVRTLDVKVGGGEYYLSVCSVWCDKIRLFENVDLTKI